MAPRPSTVQQGGRAPKAVPTSDNTKPSDRNTEKKVIEPANKRHKLSTDFTPLYMSASWTSTTGLDRVSVLLWLPSGIGAGLGMGKYGLRVVDEGTFLEVSYIWPKSITSVEDIMERARLANCELEDSEIVGFNSAVSSVRSSELQAVECQGYIELPYAVVGDIRERFNLGFTACGSLLVLIRLTAHKDQSQVQYDSGSFVFREKSSAMPVTSIKDSASGTTDNTDQAPANPAPIDPPSNNPTR